MAPQHRDHRLAAFSLCCGNVITLGVKRCDTLALCVLVSTAMNHISYPDDTTACGHMEQV